MNAPSIASHPSRAIQRCHPSRARERTPDGPMVGTKDWQCDKRKAQFCLAPASALGVHVRRLGLDAAARDEEAAQLRGVWLILRHALAQLGAHRGGHTLDVRHLGAVL